MAVLTPELLARLRPLRLQTRRATSAHGHGAHSSVQRGSGLEFAQYRSYEPGDDPRRVDWKLFARSDRYFVREAERESPLVAWIVVDASASMGQTDLIRPLTTRLDIAKGIVACALQVALQGVDRFGVLAFNNKELQAIPAGTGARQRDRCLLALDTVRPQGMWPDPTRMGGAWELLATRSLVLLLSDCFDDEAIAMAEKLAATGREVCMLQLLMADERDFPYRGGHLFVDTEQSETLLGDADALRDDYLQRFAQAHKDLQARCTRAGIRFVTHFADETLDTPLQRLFGHRGYGA